MNSSIDYDCVGGDHVCVTVGTRLCGATNMGELTWILTNTVAVKDIDRPGTYIGVPTRLVH